MLAQIPFDTWSQTLVEPWLDCPSPATPVPPKTIASGQKSCVISTKPTAENPPPKPASYPLQQRSTGAKRCCRSSTKSAIFACGKPSSRGLSAFLCGASLIHSAVQKIPLSGWTSRVFRPSPYRLLSGLPPNGGRQKRQIRGYFASPSRARAQNA